MVINELLRCIDDNWPFGPENGVIMEDDGDESGCKPGQLRSQCCFNGKGEAIIWRACVTYSVSVMVATLSVILP